MEHRVKEENHRMSYPFLFLRFSNRSLADAFFFYPLLYAVFSMPFAVYSMPFAVCDFASSEE